ncbi:LysE family translocator [Amylibacter sp. SFDW26]|uniref:LysE family translocator n=1 Tax=Amylibacter sp. SFDW26 TaxID=2652722 RepID=UPI00126238F8|nr:LysE family translocator [Amylibacter sp. SFDW26]KAB7614303.1 LysE family translocator [Amylibacter sp. SFDW26]
MNFDTYLLFTVTTAIIIFSPGPTAILVASQGASNGLARTLFSIFGITLATITYFIFSATGIASVIVASHLMFSIIKWIGVAYLLYLGLTAIFSKSGGISVNRSTVQKSRKVLFSQGFLVEFSNPKALLYFAAILPQFLDVTKAIFPQVLAMGTTTFILQIIIYGAYSYMGDRLVRGGVKHWIIKTINKTAGGALIFAGVKMASVTASN